ncbi:MAG: hypothetical protein NT157_05665 [Candidatus Micrarchaeota archaeon]|nr:hypothetical protein [Candidatus Micrarchaeota archaeon]
MATRMGLARCSAELGMIMMTIAENLVEVCSQMRVRGLTSFAVMALAVILYYYVKSHGSKYERYKKTVELLIVLGALGMIFFWAFGIFSPLSGFDSDAGSVTVDTLSCIPHCENGC